MSVRKDITIETLSSWDEYNSKPPADAATAIYSRIEATSTKITGWYWNSIRGKRRLSVGIRGVSFFLLAAGTAAPIIAAILPNADIKLYFTQSAVVALAIAGLLQFADKAFGFSSGWIRYITTVTEMENFKRSFELDWARAFIEKTTPVDHEHLKTLFNLAKNLEKELQRLQTDETVKWATEFNNGIALIDSLIKIQRDEADKKVADLQSVIKTQKDAQAANDKDKRVTEEKKAQTGAIEVNIVFPSDPKELEISLDDESPVIFLGRIWSRIKLPQGHHLLKITVPVNPPQQIIKPFDIAGGTICQMEIKI
jgi:hypothetical protein